MSIDWAFLQQCKDAMNNYRELTQDQRYASHTEKGRMQLVRVTFNDFGSSQIEVCSEWIPVSEWIKFMDELCAR